MLEAIRSSVKSAEVALSSLRSSPALATEAKAAAAAQSLPELLSKPPTKKARTERPINSGSGARCLSLNRHARGSHVRYFIVPDMLR